MTNQPSRASDRSPDDLSVSSAAPEVALPVDDAGTRSPLRRIPWAVRTDSVHLWPGATHAALVMTGLLLAAATAIVVLRMPDLPFHPARDAELRATVETYGETGVLLVKENGTGSWYGRIPGEGLVRAAGDDDPGTYLIASVMARLLGTTDPYVGLRLAMALLCAFPMLLLPMTMARVFGRARAGYAMLLLPPVTWLVNRGTVLVGTALGLRDEASPTRVYALYGLTASAAFASLVLLTYFSTRKLSRPALVAASLLMVVAAAGGNLLRSMSGLGIAAAVGVLWWVHHTGKLRALTALAVSTAAVVGSMWLPSIAMEAIDSARRQVIFNQGTDLPSSHGVWHPFFLGLSYPQPITGEPSRFGVEWSDTWAWEKAQRVDPDVLPASKEYDAIIKDFYLDEFRTHPAAAMRLYADKALYTLKYFAAMVVVILLGLALAFQRPGTHRRRVIVTCVIALPTLMLGLAPPILVMPLLYYVSELVAALGLLTALGLASIVWALSSLPSHVRATERSRLAGRITPLTQVAIKDAAESPALTFVIPSRNGADVLPRTLELLGQRLTTRDEIVVVENGSTDQTARVLSEIASDWVFDCRLVVTSSSPGLGHALRTGVLTSTGDRLLLSADDLPFDFTDLDEFLRLPDSVMVAIGSKAHPGSQVNRSKRRTAQSALFRFLREALLHSAVGDSQGTIWVDGEWARLFAALSREGGLMWTVELVMAAEQQGLEVWEVPVTLRAAHDKVTSRFRLKDAVIAVRELARLALQKDDYAQDDWVTRGQALSAATPATAGQAENRE